MSILLVGLATMLQRTTGLLSRRGEESLPLSGIWSLHDELLHARLVRSGLDRSPRDARSEGVVLVDREGRLAMLEAETRGLVLRRFDPLAPMVSQDRLLVAGVRAALFDLREDVGTVRFHLFTDRSSIIGSVRPLQARMSR